MEGSKKLKSGDFSSAGFLRAAKGPFANTFRGMVFDLYGDKRLDKAYWDKQFKNEKEQLQALTEGPIGTRAATYYGVAVQKYGEDKRKQLDAAFNRYIERIKYYFDENDEKIREYFNEVATNEEKRNDAGYRGVAHYEDRLAEKDGELYGKLNGWTKSIAKFEAQYIDDLNRIGSSQSESTSPIHQSNPNQGTIDWIVTWVLIVSGLCLIFGFCTRLAALAVAGFLAQVMLAQWPLAHGAKLDYVYYQSVEFTALLLIAAIGAGRFAGLDYILWSLCGMCCTRKSSP